MLKSLFFVSIFAFASLHLKSQNLFDIDHTREYANFLFQSRQFQLATEEYERLLFFAPQETSYRLKLIQSYRFSGDYSRGLSHISMFYQDSLRFAPPEMVDEYLKLSLLSKEFNNVVYMAENSLRLSSEKKATYILESYLLSKNWKAAREMPGLTTVKDTKLLTFALQSHSIRYKKPALAGILSALIPGLGKVYSGAWKDGLIALIFISGNTWQTIRGFDKKGYDHAYGYIFGSLTLGFYLGNIFGAVKVAKAHNRKLDEKLYQDAEKYIYSGF